MKCLIRILCAFLLFCPAFSFAGWQVAHTQTVVPASPFFQAPAPCRTVATPSYGTAPFPNRFANLGQPAEGYAISVSGSLKENLERIMNRYHWRVVWKAPYDYNFDGRVTGSSLPNVVQKILNPFPLQAVMYVSNRTMTVVPRKTPCITR